MMRGTWLRYYTALGNVLKQLKPNGKGVACYSISLAAAALHGQNNTLLYIEEPTADSPRERRSTSVLLTATNEPNSWLSKG